LQRIALTAAVLVCGLIALALVMANLSSGAL
jgi:hypothetical protein